MPVKFSPTELEGVSLVETLAIRDDRGYFSETYSKRMFGEAGFHEMFVQDNLSESSRGVLRGLHYQINPHAMGKLVRVLSGAVFDVAVDLRKGSPTFGEWVGRTLSAENRLAMWIPAGFAHGFIALDDRSLVLYKCTAIHTPDAERSLLYSDPQVGVEWPITPTLISEKDKAAPTLDKAECNFTYQR
ncbi:MAG: dTDP-4-dehydrorhamnose 3,5-epimerase [Candidatus Hydrogenedentes bacterium]|nr:dTDP-4-dehydrorhamnose 3,5-epimerase [Candidatus Hydrogenedentota bacterium]